MSDVLQVFECSSCGWMSMHNQVHNACVRCLRPGLVPFVAFRGDVVQPLYEAASTVPDLRPWVDAFPAPEEWKG